MTNYIICFGGENHYFEGTEAPMIGSYAEIYSNGKIASVFVERKNSIKDGGKFTQKFIGRTSLLDKIYLGEVIDANTLRKSNEPIIKEALEVYDQGEPFATYGCCPEVLFVLNKISNWNLCGDFCPCENCSEKKENIH